MYASNGCNDGARQTAKSTNCKEPSPYISMYGGRHPGPSNTRYSPEMSDVIVIKGGTPFGFFLVYLAKNDFPGRLDKIKVHISTVSVQINILN